MRFVKESCEKVASFVMNCRHSAHKHRLDDSYNLIDYEGRLNVQCGEYLSYLIHKCVKESVKKRTDISNEIDLLPSIQFEIEETSKETKHVQNSNDNMYFKKPKEYATDFFVFYICKNCQNQYLAGNSDEITGQ